MSQPENIFQKWVWEGLNENFKPEGDLAIDENGDDVFSGILYYEEEYFEVFEHGLVIGPHDLPLSIIAGITGMKVHQIIELPSSGNAVLDSQINEGIINDVLEESGKIKLTIGIQA